jgi:hypothetical protein
MEVVVGLRDARELFEQPERTPLDDDFEPWCVVRAIWTLIPTGIVFVASLVLSRLAVAASSDWLSETFAEALIVIGWVVLWSPVAILGTDIWVLIGLRRAYRRLASSQIEVRSR